MTYSNILLDIGLVINYSMAYSNEVFPMEGTVGQRVLARRGELELTRGELAREMGVSERIIHFWETDTSQPSCVMLVKLSVTLGVSSDWLLFGRESVCAQCGQ